MKKYFAHFSFFFIILAFLTGCAQTKQYTPNPVEAQYILEGMPSEIVRVQVNDLRAEKENSEQLIKIIKGQVLSALSPEKIIGNHLLYNLQINIIEHRSFATSGNWNAVTKLRIKLIDSQNNIIGNWEALGNTQRHNMWGYATAKAVSQDAYNIAIADMMSNLSTVSLKN